MRYKIVADSSSDILELQECAYSCVPLKIITDEKEYVDDKSLDVDEMIADLQKYKGASKSSCPSIGDWKDSFEDYDGVIAVAITSGLSGSYNSSKLAIEDYLEENPGKEGFAVDTLSAGAEVALIVDKLKELVVKNLDMSEIKNKIMEYKKRTHLVFALGSLKNLANNGRVSPAVAKLTGILGIRIVGKASNEGTLEVTGKVRGAAKAITELFKNMVKTGFNGGRVRIHHCKNEDGANTLRDMIKTQFPSAEVIIQRTRGLCSFYAEEGGLLVGYEGNEK